jgi:hypothetical protein
MWCAKLALSCHSGDYEEYAFLGCDAVLSVRRLPLFRIKGLLRLLLASACCFLR